jgi:hypothetical protein
MRSPSRGRDIRRVRRLRGSRTLDALGYVALVLLIALVTYRHLSPVSRAPEPQIATSVSIQGASVEPAAHH